MEDSFFERAPDYSLSEETAISRSANASDLDDGPLNPHVEYFLESVRRTLQLSTMSLQTPDDAQLTLAKINELQRKVQDHRLTAQALKKLLLNGLEAHPADADSTILH